MKKLILTITSLVILLGCKKDKLHVVIPDPERVTLISPLQDAACLTGEEISSTQNSVTFNWSDAAHADEYEVVLKNLSTNAVSTHLSTENSIQLVLEKHTPYSWYIVSKGNTTVVKAFSSKWRFYNSGTGELYHAPFPADLLSPAFGNNVTAVDNKITLDWAGSDVDNDLSSYAVYFGTTQTPPLLAEDLSASELANVTVTANTTYYWKVITRDRSGNTSDSGLSQFKVN